MNSWLAHFDNTLRSQLPELAPSAWDEASLGPLQKAASKALPPAFREFLLWRPHDVSVAFTWELPGSTGGHMLELPEIEEIVGAWNRPSPPGTRNWWSPLWIPMLIGAEGDILCVDLPGTFGNTSGSLLQFWPDVASRPVLFPHVEGWLRWVAVAMEQGMGRAFLEENRLDIVLNRKAEKLYRDFFPNYPVKHFPEMLGLGFMNRVLNVLRRYGLQSSANCVLPKPLTLDALAAALQGGLFREDGSDGEAVRVSGLCQGNDGGGAWMVYALLKPAPSCALLEAVVAVPENAGDGIQAGLTLTYEHGDPVTGSRRLSEAAFLCHQAGCGAEALALLQRALQWDPQNSVAARSLAALEARNVNADPARIRPLLLNIGAIAPLM